MGSGRKLGGFVAKTVTFRLVSSSNLVVRDLGELARNSKGFKPMLFKWPLEAQMSLLIQLQTNQGKYLTPGLTSLFGGMRCLESSLPLKREEGRLSELYNGFGSGLNLC